MSEALERVARMPGLLASAPLPPAISRLLARPDLRIAPHERSIAFAAGLGEPFTVDATGHIRLGPHCLAHGEAGPARLRHALELALLLPRLPHAPVLAGLAAARVAALFASIHGVAAEPWQVIMAAPEPPDRGELIAVWARVARLQIAAATTPSNGELARLAEAWACLGPSEALLPTGGDQRLRVDPGTGLNGYGCSHRPRPWAVTFASSTASSSSERGFAAAEASRQRVTLGVLTATEAGALGSEAGQVRAAIAQLAGVPEGGAVVLAASGTDCELIALALATSGDPRPVANLLIAPEETGSGVPLAATGCHFAADTARGAGVVKGSRVSGFRDDVTLVRIPARAPDGRLRPAGRIDADCADAAAAAIAAGGQVLLHLLDVSKTGYLAPGTGCIAEIAARHPGAVRVVVDACQGRLTRARIADYLGRGWIVLITGSKFLTGPPFAGAVLVPTELSGRLQAALPDGLGAYSSRPEWPAVAGAATLPGLANYGLILRWQAALAEWAALAAVAPAHQHDILTRFCARVRQGIDANPDLAWLEVPPPARPDPAWDSVQTIMSFTVCQHHPLDPADARRVYHWLNADLRPGLPSALNAEDERLACLRCHIGQPVPLPGAGGRDIGVLRISAGARLVSGEPSHHDLDEEARLLREIRDALSVLAKISLILAHWGSLLAADPKPSF